MSSEHTHTVVLSERQVDGTLSVELPHLGRAPCGVADLNTAAFNFVKVLSEDLGSNTVRLPSLPEVAIKIRHALVSEHSSVEHVARIVGSDPALSVRVIRAANAACHAKGAKPVSDLLTALMRLGLDAVVGLAMSVALEQILLAKVPDELSRFLRVEWEHSILVAAIAQSLARTATALDSDEAFLAGLLAGVGKLYILRRAKEYPELLGSDQALRLVMSAWHHSVGFALINHWGLALDVARAANDYESYDIDSVHEPSLTTVVHLADRVAAVIERNNDSEPLQFPRCGSLNVGDETWRSIVTAAEEDLKNLHHVLGI